MGDFNQAVQGAAGGAATGAMFGPWGAVIGGGIGGIAGYLGGDDQKQQYQDQLNKLAQGYGNRTAPQAGYSGFRSNQAGLIAQLEAMARGDGPSAAQTQMAQAMDRAAGAQSSAAAGAGGRGVNAGGALRMAANNTAAIQSQGARDSSILRAQEQANAMNMLGSNIQAGRSADENINTANMNSALQTMSLNQGGQLQALLAAMGVAQPGTGTQILGAGATAAPALNGMMNARNNNGQGNMNDPSQYWQGSKRTGSAYGLPGAYSGYTPPPAGGGYQGVRMPDGTLYNGG